jgi:tetratricopeptide (TPR) repeat protein
MMELQNAIDAAIVENQLSSGRRLSQCGRFVEAEACARKVIALCPEHAMAHNDIGFARQMQGDNEAALDAYGKALQIDPQLRTARRNLAALLARVGRRDESLVLCHAELRTREGLQWLQELVSTAMTARDLGYAGELAAIGATLRWGSDWYPPKRDRSLQPFPIRAPERRLTIPKLRHDIEQFEYLQRQGVVGDEFTPIIATYRSIIDRLAQHGEHASTPLEGENLSAIGHVFNRIIHLRHTPRVARALSDAWDPVAVESQYLDRPPGVVVVDEFLTSEALRELRAFCLESTVWSANRYAHGRLGAFFHDGFNCPLLLQIAEELRAAMPRVIGDRHTLRQLWGFKNAPYLPGASTTHADFAAVNVNFWITPDDANLDPSCGGLVVYELDAPLNWDFHTYNGRSDVIKPFLQRQHARSVTIPYRQNRAVIFNSDLFHGTATVRFRPEYEYRRINVTMLYGVREEDHRHLALAEPTAGSGAAAWRSAAFARARRGR